MTIPGGDDKTRNDHSVFISSFDTIEEEERLRYCVWPGSGQATDDRWIVDIYGIVIAASKHFNEDEFATYIDVIVVHELTHLLSGICHGDVCKCIIGGPSMEAWEWNTTIGGCFSEKLRDYWNTSIRSERIYLDWFRVACIDLVAFPWERKSNYTECINSQKRLFTEFKNRWSG